MTDEQIVESITAAIDTALDRIVPRVVRDQLRMAGVTPHTDRAKENEPVTKKSVLEAAIQTVADRGVPYGGVEDNFNRIARLWNAHLSNSFANALENDVVAIIPQLQTADVAMMMALMKIARLQANPSHADSWIDVAGYAACGGEIGAKLTLDKSE